MPKRPQSAPRVVALVGPYQSGKTTLLESLLYTTGAMKTRGVVGQGTAVGDRQPEARSYEMGVEMNIANTHWLGDEYTFIDCPGSIEFSQETYDALRVADAAVVVAEPTAARAVTLAPILHFLDEQKIPHVVFINKVDTTSERLKDVLEALRTVSARPLVLREVPIREKGVVTGFVDLVSERAYQYSEGKHSQLMEVPSDLVPEELASREALVEALADFDDDLLEQILEDVMPSKDVIFEQLAKDFKEDLVVPVFFGSALQCGGITRLMKLLRHETPEPSVTAARLGIDVDVAGVAAEVFKTEHIDHVGKMSLLRVWRGGLASGETVQFGEETVRIGGLYRFHGDSRHKLDGLKVGQVGALARASALRTGDWLGDPEEGVVWPEVLAPLYSQAIEVTKRADDVKLLGALQDLAEDDPSLIIEQNADTHELLLHGQGSQHLAVVLDRLKNRNKLVVTAARPTVPYKETIQKSVDRHTRYKRQTGGHGQFADIQVTVAPTARGEGFVFTESIVGGSVPRRFIPAVEHGARDAMVRGPLGFPVVDVSMTLNDGQYHAVDSSDMAFKTCAGMAMREAFAEGQPVLLEPILEVQIAVPTEFTSGIQRSITSRRGQLLNFAPREGWHGWDQLTASMPQGEIYDLIQDLRSLTLGVGTYTFTFDRLQELRDRAADDVVAARKLALGKH